MPAMEFPQLLLIAGTGRNSGKTTLACNIIRRFAKSYSIFAIKITPHFHADLAYGKILIKKEHLVVAEELQHNTGKDSSLMLKAGATRAFFMVSKDMQLAEAWGIVTGEIPENALIICESGGLRQLVKPGLFLVMHQEDESTFKPGTEVLKSLADGWIVRDEKQIDQIAGSIAIRKNRWVIN
jgi:hypothetical protein